MPIKDKMYCIICVWVYVAIQLKKTATHFLNLGLEHCDVHDRYGEGFIFQWLTMYGRLCVPPREVKRLQIRDGHDDHGQKI